MKRKPFVFHKTTQSLHSTPQVTHWNSVEYHVKVHSDLLIIFW